MEMVDGPLSYSFDALNGRESMGVMLGSMVDLDHYFPAGMRLQNHSVSPYRHIAKNPRQNQRFRTIVEKPEKRIVRVASGVAKDLLDTVFQ